MNFENKIEIYSIHYNRPDFIPLQFKSFKKFIQEDFEFIVIDNSITEDMSKNIYQVCYDLGVKYLKSDNQTPHGLYGWSHIHGMNFFKNNLINSKSKFIFLIEHDIFFCSNYDRINKIVNNYGVCGVSQRREDINYFHPGILLFNKEKSGDLINFDFRGDVIEDGIFNKELNGVRVDTGGQTHKYIKNNPDKIFFIDNYVNEYLEDVNLNHVFYHMVRGSNWIGTEDELNKKKINIIENILNS